MNAMTHFAITLDDAHTGAIARIGPADTLTATYAGTDLPPVAYVINGATRFTTTISTQGDPHCPWVYITIGHLAIDGYRTMRGLRAINYPSARCMADSLGTSGPDWHLPGPVVAEAYALLLRGEAARLSYVRDTAGQLVPTVFEIVDLATTAPAQVKGTSR